MKNKCFEKNSFIEKDYQVTYFRSVLYLSVFLSLVYLFSYRMSMSYADFENIVFIISRNCHCQFYYRILS